MKHFAPLLLLALALPAGGAEVYRCVTENGVVRYSDTPCRDGETEKLDIESRPTDESAVRERAQQRREQITALNQAEAEAEKAAAEARKQEEERAAQCAAARERYQKLQTARRVYTGEGDNREYLSAAEIEARRAEAAQKVGELCAGQ